MIKEEICLWKILMTVVMIAITALIAGVTGSLGVAYLTIALCIVAAAFTIEYMFVSLTSDEL